MSAFLRNPWFLLLSSAWQVVVVLTPISLYGYWTDLVAFLAWLCLLGYIALQGRSVRPWVRWCAGTLVAVLLVMFFLVTSPVAGLLAFLNAMGARTVPQENKLQGALLVNQYFIPVGAPGCGMGQLITAKAPVFFPLIEYRTDFDPCTHEDWGYLIDHGSWEGWGEAPR